MSVIWYKIWHDLWHNKARTILAVLSIAVGVFAIGAIFGMIDQLLSTMDEAHFAANPAHVSLFLNKPIDRPTADRLKSIKGIEDIEPLKSISVRYKLKTEAEWQPGLLITRDYEDQTYTQFWLNEGPWPEKNVIGVERLTSNFFGVDIGDKVIFELDGTDRAFPVVSKIRHPFIEPPSFGGNAVFFMDEQGLERFNIPTGKFNDLWFGVTPYSDDFSKDIASEVKNRLAKEDVGVNFTVYLDPIEHWGRPFIEGFNFVLRILALVSLFLSVILVTNTLTALITQQTNQIGIIKAVGGSRWVIIKIYLVVVLIYGFLALLISLPLGAIVAFGMSRWFLEVFNIEHNGFEISRRALVLQVMAAIAVPLLAALWPVLHGSAITVREAIATYGLGADFGFSRLDRLVERIGQRFFSSPYAIALGNMFRRKGRLVLTQLVLIAAGMMFLLVMSLSASMFYTLDNDLARRNFDLRLGFEDKQRIDRVLKMAAGVEGVKQAEMWFDKPVSVLLEGQRLREAGVGAEIVGIPAHSTMFRPLMIKGRWLRPDDEQAVVIAKDLADEHNIAIGDTVTLDLGELGDSEWQVVGITYIIVRDAFSNDPIYAPLESIFKATKKHNRGTRLVVASASTDPGAVKRLNLRLKSLYESRQMDINVFTTATSQEDLGNALGRFGIVTSMFFGLALIMAAVGGVGLTGSLSISVVERTREIGVMRAVGAKSRTIMGMFMLEGVLQGLLSWTITIPLSFIITPPVARTLGQTMLEIPLDFQYNWVAVGSWLVIVIIIAALASILPARSATQISVRESLAYA